MLFSQAVCDNCGAGFASSVVVAERRGDPVSYRRSAGPCPRCGGRGRIPDWIFRLHGAASAARDQATEDENTAVLAAVRQCQAAPLDQAARAAFALALTGSWRGVAITVGRIPLAECEAAVAMLGRMLEDVVPTGGRPDGREAMVAIRTVAGPAAAGRPGATAASGATASAAPGTPGAGRSPMSA